MVFHFGRETHQRDPVVVVSSRNNDRTHIQRDREKEREYARTPKPLAGVKLTEWPQGRSIDRDVTGATQ